MSVPHTLSKISSFKRTRDYQTCITYKTWVFLECERFPYMYVNILYIRFFKYGYKFNIPGNSRVTRNGNSHFRTYEISHFAVFMIDTEQTDKKIMKCENHIDWLIVARIVCTHTPIFNCSS